MSVEIDGKDRSDAASGPVIYERFSLFVEAAIFLDEIPRLGPKTKKKLLSVFGSINNLSKAEDKEIVKIIGPKLAKNLRQYI